MVLLFTLNPKAVPWSKQLGQLPANQGFLGTALRGDGELSDVSAELQALPPGSNPCGAELDSLA